MFLENIGLGTVTLQVLGRLSIHGPVIFPLYELIIKAQQVQYCCNSSIFILVSCFCFLLRSCSSYHLASPPAVPSRRLAFAGLTCLAWTRRRETSPVYPSFEGTSPSVLLYYPLPPSSSSSPLLHCALMELYGIHLLVVRTLPFPHSLYSSIS
jgi:hypothetical protein